MTNHQTYHSSLKKGIDEHISGLLLFKEHDSISNPIDYKYFAGGGGHD